MPYMLAALAVKYTKLTAMSTRVPAPSLWWSKKRPRLPPRRLGAVAAPARRCGAAFPPNTSTCTSLRIHGCAAHDSTVPIEETCAGTIVLRSGVSLCHAAAG